LLVFIAEQNLVEILLVMLVMLLSTLRNMSHVKTWHHPQNRKYITYGNIVGAEVRKGNVQKKFGEVW